jgi:hypothetical protein
MCDSEADPVKTGDALGFFLGWFVLGGVVGFLTFAWFSLGAGLGWPTRLVSAVTSLALFVLLPVLALGGLPASIQMAHGRPWKTHAKVAAVVCAAMWTLFMVLYYVGWTYWYRQLVLPWEG